MYVYLVCVVTGDKNNSGSCRGRKQELPCVLKQSCDRRRGREKKRVKACRSDRMRNKINKKTLVNVVLGFHTRRIGSVRVKFTSVHHCNEGKGNRKR